MSPTAAVAGSWNMPTNLPMWSSSQTTGLGGLFSNENKPPEPAQHADWIQNPVNPFTVSLVSGGFFFVWLLGKFHFLFDKRITMTVLV